MLDYIKNIFSSKPDIESSEYSISVLAQRVKGTTLPLSIGTALIFEADTAMINKWDKQILINLLTLVRNIISAVPSIDKLELKADDILDVLYQEMDILSQVIPETKSGTIVDYYLPDYSHVDRAFPMAKLKTFSTPIQRAEQQLLGKIIQRLRYKHQDKEDPFTYIAPSSWELEKSQHPTTLLTSFPTDLLSQYRFPKLTLLESHTGRVKVRSQWNTKLHQGANDNIEYLPFCKFTIQVFGDGVFFLSSNVKIKKYVMDLAIKYHWHSLTSIDRIRSGISHIKNPADRDALLKYL